MTTKIRLARAGAKKRPYYRIVVANSTAPRDGDFLEKVGTYNPLLDHSNQDRIALKKERIVHWMECGAKPTDRVVKFLIDAGIELPAHVRKHVEIKLQSRKPAQPKKAKN
jgi:small subunit ribosomal protein S16